MPASHVVVHLVKCARSAGLDLLHGLAIASIPKQGDGSNMRLSRNVVVFDNLNQPLHGDMTILPRKLLDLRGDVRTAGRISNTTRQPSSVLVTPFRTWLRGVRHDLRRYG
jgi:hypothetical protein